MGELGGSPMYPPIAGRILTRLTYYRNLADNQKNVSLYA